jgi:NAD(P)-dependent dehydrogenase (short-subunit alcohol dehydrogenase family)
MGPMHAASFGNKLFPPKKVEGALFPPTWLNLTARVGSISENKMGGWYSYRASKAAMNQFTKTMAVEMGRSGVRVLSFHPGTVDTDLSRPFVSKTYRNRVLSVEECGECIWDEGIVGGAEETGVFVDWEGKRIGW